MATSKKTTSTKATKATTKAAKTEEAKVAEDVKKVLSDQDVEVIKPQPIVTEVKEKTAKATATKKTATKKSKAAKDEAKAETTEDVKEDTTMENTNINVNFDEEKFAIDVLESFNKFNTVLETMSNNIISSQKEMNALQAKVDANEKNIKIISKYLADKEKSELEAEAETETKAEAAEEGATEEGKKKWSTKKKVAVGVGIGVGVLAVAGVGYAIYKHNKDKNDYADIDDIVRIDAPSDDDVDDVVVTEF